MLSARGALTLAGLCVLGLAATWLLADLVPATHVRDAVALADFTRLDHPVLEAPASALLLLLDPPFYAAWAAVLVTLALRRRRLGLALALVPLLVLAPLSAELLKPLLAHSHARVSYTYIAPASWPSGHATAVAILVWAALMVAPPGRRRPLAIVGLLLALCVGCSLLILAWHMPSDVLGGYLLATLWASLAIAALQASEPEPWEPGSHSDSDPVPASPLAARASMKRRSESRLR
jgi:membrane-associated phospholipid phosphatase